jgi:hypothetical protein
VAWLNGETVFNEYLSDVLHGETQIEPRSVSLTASTLYELNSPGELDFGGSEFQLGDRDPVAPEKRDTEDDYGWWSLAGDNYLLELNETITVSGTFEALLQPHDHMNWNGAQHPTLWLSEEDADARLLLPLSVPESGLAIKENARVSALRVRRDA